MTSGSALIYQPRGASCVKPKVPKLTIVVGLHRIAIPIRRIATCTHPVDGQILRVAISRQILYDPCQEDKKRTPPAPIAFDRSGYEVC